MNRTVVIAGAGPVGLMLAAELRLADVPAIVIEPLTDPVQWARSLFLQNRSVEVLRQRGLDWFSDSPRWVSYNFGFLSMKRLANDAEFVPFYAPQHEFEGLLGERATALGTQLRRGHRVTGVRQDDQGVDVEIASPDGSYELRAAYLVGCDGGRSSVRKLAGIPFPGTASTLSGITAWVTLTEDQFQTGIQAEIYPTGIFAIARMESRAGLYRATTIEFETELPDRDTEVPIDELVEAARRIAGVDIKIASAPWVSRFGNATRVAAKYRHGRVLLAGDAAHIHFASAAQGLNTGIQDAVNLGWKLAAEVNGWAPAGLLDSYHDERHPVGERVCMFSQAQVALYHPIATVTPLRQVISELLQQEDVSRHMLELATGMGIHYPAMASVAGHRDAHPLIGRRIPNVPLVGSDGAATVFEALRAGQGALIDLTGGMVARNVSFGWDGRVPVVTAEAAPGLDAAVALVRPDGYVAYADRDGADDEVLVKVLTRWFGAPVRAVASA